MLAHILVTTIGYQPTTVDRIRLLVWDLNAEFLRHCQSPWSLWTMLPIFKPTSSIAMTTSTVSKLSSPRSFVKCEDEESYR